MTDRPSLEDETLVATICDRLINGESMKTICADPDMPAQSTVYLKMANDPAFRRIIACAREAQQEALIDETIDLADAATMEDHQVVKLRIWARQWRAAKLAPKTYGDKIAHVGGGEGDSPIDVAYTNRDRAKAMAALVAKQRG